MRLFLMALVISISSLVYGNENQNQDILDHIREHAQASIERIDDEKVFLKPEHLWLHEGQFFVVGEDGNAIRLPHLFSDENGFYLARARDTLYFCASRNCGWVYRNHRPASCTNCRGTDFIVRYQ